MGCNPELVSAFLDGELDGVIVGAVTDHLIKCDECRRTMSRLALVKGALADKYALCQPEELTFSVMNAISNEHVGPPSSSMGAFLRKIGVPVP